MSAYVIVHWGPQAPSGRTSNPRVVRLLRRHDAVVLPASDMAADADTSTISVPDMAHASTLAAALRALEGVDAAYPKPGEELP